MPNLVTGWMTACDDGVKEIGSKVGKPGVPRLTNVLVREMLEVKCYAYRAAVVLPNNLGTLEPWNPGTHCQNQGGGRQYSVDAGLERVYGPDEIRSSGGQQVIVACIRLSTQVSVCLRVPFFVLFESPRLD